MTENEILTGAIELFGKQAQEIVARQLITDHICNRKRCANCHPECTHTFEARFAKNFVVNELGYLVEKQEGAERK